MNKTNFKKDKKRSLHNKDIINNLKFENDNSNLDQSKNYYEKAKFYYEEGNDDYAKTFIELALEKEEKNIELILDIGDLEFMMGNYINSKYAYLKALELDSKNEFAIIGLGASYGRINENLKAIEYYTKAIELNPKSSRAYYNRSYAYTAVKEYSKALYDISMLLEDSRDVELYDLRAMIYNKVEKYQEAINDISKIIEKEEENFELYERRSNLYFKLKRYKEAFEDYKKVSAIDSNTLTKKYILYNKVNLDNTIDDEFVFLEKMIASEKNEDKIRAIYKKRNSIINRCFSIDGNIESESEIKFDDILNSYIVKFTKNYMIFKTPKFNKITLFNLETSELILSYKIELFSDKNKYDYEIKFPEIECYEISEKYVVFLTYSYKYNCINRIVTFDVKTGKEVFFKIFDIENGEIIYNENIELEGELLKIYFDKKVLLNNFNDSSCYYEDENVILSECEGKFKEKEELEEKEVSL